MEKAASIYWQRQVNRWAGPFTRPRSAHAASAFLNRLSRGCELHMFKTTENTEAAFADTEGVLGSVGLRMLKRQKAPAQIGRIAERRICG